jgi:hypothetical protein
VTEKFNSKLQNIDLLCHYSLKRYFDANYKVTVQQMNHRCQKVVITKLQDGIPAITFLPVTNGKVQRIT